jgi:hypothetical protein
VISLLKALFRVKISSATEWSTRSFPRCHFAAEFDPWPMNVDASKSNHTQSSADIVLYTKRYYHLAREWIQSKPRPSGRWFSWQIPPSSAAAPSIDELLPVKMTHRQKWSDLSGGYNITPGNFGEAKPHPRARGYGQSISPISADPSWKAQRFRLAPKPSRDKPHEEPEDNEEIDKPPQQ